MSKISSFMVRIYQVSPDRFSLSGKVRSISDGSEIPFQSPEELIQYLILHSIEFYEQDNSIHPDQDTYPPVYPDLEE